MSSTKTAVMRRKNKYKMRRKWLKIRRKFQVKAMMLTPLSYSLSPQDKLKTPILVFTPIKQTNHQITITMNKKKKRIT
jgi:hypothetical protein